MKAKLRHLAMIVLSHLLGDLHKTKPEEDYYDR